MKLLQALFVVAIFAVFWAFVFEAIDRDAIRKEASIAKYGRVTVH